MAQRAWIGVLALAGLGTVIYVVDADETALGGVVYVAHGRRIAGRVDTRAAALSLRASIDAVSATPQKAEHRTLTFR